MIKIEIDSKSGFCFGVVNAINKAEQELLSGEPLYCLGDIVHNDNEIKRLEALGMISIDHKQFSELHDVKVLLRAHGEPPSTYKIAAKNNITIVDATCPVVLKLQSKIKRNYLQLTPNDQLVILGKAGHAEVNGLVGQTDNNTIVVDSEADLEKIDYSKNVFLFAQTTRSLDSFEKFVATIESRLQAPYTIKSHDTVCRQVANRKPNIRKFAVSHDIILFVGGKKSSNGKILFEECLKVNPHSYYIVDLEDIDKVYLQANISSVGICGATSTPTWLMEKVAQRINILYNYKE